MHVAILADSFPARAGNSDPQVLASVLRNAGCQVSLLKSGELADAAVLTTARFDCIIFPYGPSYPYAAFDTIKAYLKSGGGFLSMGGYAFDEPCAPDESGRMIPIEQSRNPKPLNTRHGKAGDTLGLEPDQIGVFDPCYLLRNVHEISGAVSSVPIGGVTGPFGGYAACSLLGSDNPVFPEKWGRHIPVLVAQDSTGATLGDAGAIAHNYAGPYAGSSWAFFGITNTNLFAKGGLLLPAVPDIVKALTRKLFLHSLETDFACYRQGETVKTTCKVANLGKRDCSATVRFNVRQRDHGGVGLRSVAVDLKAGETKTVETQFQWRRFDSDLYEVEATLTVGSEWIDSVQSGFVAYDAKVMASGLKLNFKDNYFRDGDRPVLLSGANQTGAIFYSGNENPLVWDRDLARMSDSGLNIVRVLHFSPFVSEKPSYGSVRPIDLKIDNLPEGIGRKLDALVQLCQKHKIVLFLSIHDWMGVELSDDELAAQKQFAKVIASRYRDVPGFMIDIQNEPHIQLPKDADTAADLRRNVLLNKWAKANYDGAKAGNPNVLVTVGFLQEYWALNKLACVDGLDFANMHSYNTIEVLRGDLKLFDRRFQGKSISLGEFGSVVDHDKRIRGEDSAGQDWNRYLLTGHYLFGEGGSFLLNWCWKDMSDVVFPWGINYTCDGPRKDILKAFRNQSLLMRQVRPVYRAPEVFLVVPMGQLVGTKSGENVKALYAVVDAMLSARADFGTVDDEHLDLLPASAKLLVYPGVPDAASKQLKAFTQRGGTVCATPDASFLDALKALGDAANVRASAGHAFRLREHNGALTIVLVNPDWSATTIRISEPRADAVEVTLSGSGTGLARFDSSGKLVAVESAGPVKLADGTIIPMTGHWALYSADGKPLAASTELVALPFGEGEIDLTPLKNTAGLTVQQGDVIDGRWRRLHETLNKQIKADAVTPFDIRILAAKDRLEAVGKYVAEEIMLR